jgi:hypothetical protein
VVDLRRYLFMYVSLFVGIVCTSVIYTPHQYQNVSEYYQITHKISDGLKVYAQFAGRQFLIINHDPFDWVDVTVAVNARIRENQVVAESVASDEIIFAVPRIRVGEMYTLQANQLTAQAFSGIQALPTQAYYLRILGRTPWGLSSWDGRWE